MLQQRVLLIVSTTALLWPASVGAGITEVNGVTGRGAAYRFQVPDGMDGDVWNGRVVYYAHGGQPPKLFAAPFIQPEPFLDGLLALGFAVAQSSYSGTGWAVKEAIVEMHQLQGLFRARFGAPTRAYLLGRSLGGLIVLSMADRYPGQYDGVLPICAVVGGAHMTHDEFLFMRTAFDVYYPGALPGTALDVPDEFGFADAFGAVFSAVFGDPAGALAMASEPLLNVNAADFSELTLNLALRMALQAELTGELVARSHGHNFFDNLDVVFDDPTLDARIERFVSHPDAERYLDRYFEPSGYLRIPVITLHNVRDPITSIEHEYRFADVVDAAGSSALLVQRTVDRFGHCAFNDQEVVNAMVDLVNWVEAGVVAIGGDVTVP